MKKMHKIGTLYVRGGAKLKQWTDRGEWIRCGVSKIRVRSLRAHGSLVPFDTIHPLFFFFFRVPLFFFRTFQPQNYNDCKTLRFWFFSVPVPDPTRPDPIRRHTDQSIWNFIVFTTIKKHNQSTKTKFHYYYSFWMNFLCFSILPLVSCHCSTRPPGTLFLYTDEYIYTQWL